MFKKIISLLLCLCMLSGFATIANAATVSGIDKYEKVEILKVLGMLGEDYNNLTIEWDKPVTRADFAFLAASVLKKNYVASDKVYFYDISKQHWASPSVSTLVECGFLDVNEEKKFYPTENITLEDAATIAVKAVGYNFDFSNVEGISYMSMATQMGITKGVSGMGELTLEGVITLLYNTLIAEVIDFSHVSKGNPVYGNSGETYLEKEYSISYRQGILEGFDGISFNGSDIDDNMAMISGEEFEAGNIDLRDMLGCTILYMYDFSDEDDYGKILWAKKYKSEELTLYYVENNVKFDPSTYKLSYYETETGRKKNINIDRTVDVIYNDEYVVSGIEELLNRELYSIKLIKNGSGNSYSKIILNCYESAVVEAVDTKGEGIYDRLSKTLISFGQCDRYEIIKDNHRISLADLKSGDVLSIYTSSSGNRVRVLVSNNVVGGKITSRDIEDDYQYITLDETTYRGAQAGVYWEESSSMPVNLYLDANGHIVYVEKYVAQGNLAYIRDIRLDKYEEFITVEMFKSDGKIVKVNTAETLRIDGTKYKYAEDAFDALGGRELIPSLMLYKTDVNGLITHIYFPSTDKNAELKIVQSNVSGTYRASGRIGRKSFINDETLIFSIPRNPKNAYDDEFVMVQKSGLRADSSYTFSTYSVSNEVDYEEIIVLHNREHKTSEVNGLLVTKIYSGINEFEEVVDFIEGYSGTNFVTVQCDPSCSADNLEKGMYITYDVKNNGSASNITIRCDYDGGIRPVDRELHKTTTFSSGYVNKVVGEIVRIGDNSGADFDTVYNFVSSIPVLIYTDDGEVEIGSVANLKPYEVAGNNCSFVFTQIKNGGSQIYIIYE